MSKKEKCVAVRLEGPFTEWYSPNWREPYEDDADYRDYYEKHILDEKPVIGPSLGDADTEYISNDLQCLAERLCVDAEDWDDATEDLIATAEMCLWDGKERLWEYEGCEPVKVMPYRKSELPPINEESLKVYGKYAGLIRERYEGI